MSIRRAIVEVDLDGLNVTEFCAQHGVSRWFFYDLRRRVAAEGQAALGTRSRAPKRVANHTPPLVEDAIVEIRKALLDFGTDAGPATIHYHLPTRLPPGTPVPSEATIWRVLTRRGFVTPEPKKAPKHSHLRFAAERANECWQIDDTEWELVDGTPVKIIHVLDDCTRVLVASKAVSSCTAEAALTAFLEGAEEWGLPARFLSDNAKAFRFGLAQALAGLGVGSRHSRPHHPQTCGKVERYHQTEHRFLRAQPPAETLDTLQEQLDRHRDYYNHQRPHRSLGRRRPADVFAATPKDGPADRPLGAETRVHRVVVQQNGIVGIGSRYSISVGSTHRGRRALLVVTGPSCHVFVEGKLVRALTLDPTRRSHPLHARPGRPPTVRDVPRDV